VGLWNAPNLIQDLPDLNTWAEVATGLELDSQDQVQSLDTRAWHERSERLSRLSAPPPEPTQQLDPILFGSDPTARGEALAAIGLTARSQIPFAEAIHVRPLNSSALVGRARFFAARSEPDKAAALAVLAVSAPPGFV
jgi:hypothetical protein